MLRRIALRRGGENTAGGEAREDAVPERSVVVTSKHIGGLALSMFFYSLILSIFRSKAGGYPYSFLIS